MPMTNEQMEARITELEGLVAKAEEALSAAVLQNELAQMDEEDAAAYDGLSDTEKAEFAKADQEGREALLSKSAERIEKANTMPMEIQKRFDELQKSLNEAQAKLAAAETIAKAATEQQRMVALVKQAETEFPNLAGTAEDKAKILKSLDALPEADREAVIASMRAANEAMGAAMQPVGKSSATPVGNAWNKITSLAKSIVEKDGSMTQDVAIARVVEQNPELYTQYLKESGSAQ